MFSFRLEGGSRGLARPEGKGDRGLRLCAELDRGLAGAARSGAGQGSDGDVVAGMRQEEGTAGMEAEAMEGGDPLVSELAGAVPEERGNGAWVPGRTEDPLSVRG